MNKLSSKFCKISGTLMILTSFVLFGLSAFMYVKPYQSVNITKMKQDAYRDCGKLAESYGYGIQKEPAKNLIYVNSTGIDKWEKDLGTSSLLLQGCYGFEVKQYCYGKCKPKNSKTEVQGLVLTLRYVEPKIPD
ncbi:hypothetical protein [Vibrio owensii]|uniref:hypothetical protein n=1 Tax=Vibrio owensii TaxID=696485 RepID=UPI003CC5827D